jgi:hypothetical protein
MSDDLISIQITFSQSERIISPGTHKMPVPGPLLLKTKAQKLANVCLNFPQEVLMADSVCNKSEGTDKIRSVKEEFITSGRP